MGAQCAGNTTPGSGTCRAPRASGCRRHSPARASSLLLRVPVHVKASRNSRPSRRTCITSGEFLALSSSFVVLGATVLELVAGVADREERLDTGFHARARTCRSPVESRSRRPPSGSSHCPGRTARSRRASSGRPSGPCPWRPGPGGDAQGVGGRAHLHVETDDLVEGEGLRLVLPPGQAGRHVSGSPFGASWPGASCSGTPAWFVEW